MNISVNHHAASSTPKIDGAGTAEGDIQGVASIQQQLRQVGAVLTRNAGNESFHSNPLTPFNA